MTSVAGVAVSVGLLAALAFAVLAWAVRQQAVAVAAGVPLVVAAGFAGGQGWLDSPLALAGAAFATLAFTEATRLAVDLRRRGGPVAVEPAVHRAALGALALPGAVALLAGALVAAVARTDPAGGWLIAALAGAALSLGALAWALRTVAGPDPAAAAIGRRRPAPVTRGAALAVVALAGLVAAGAAAHIDFRDEATRRAAQAPVDRQPAPETDADPGQPADDGPVAGREGGGLSPPWVLVGVAVVGAVLLILSRREQLVPPEDLVPDASAGPEPLPGIGVVAPVVTVSQDDVVASVREALGFLRADLEPRLAVRCAYASVAAGLGRDERARRAEETEGEYLHRALVAFGAGGPPLARLTELFAVARFSDEAVDERMRQEALEALELVRAAVAG